MGHDRFRTVNDAIVLRAAPAGVFVVFGILHFFKKATLGPNVLSESATDHAKEMLPVGRHASGAKAAFIIMSVNGTAIRTRDLPAKNGGRSRVQQRLDERAE